MENAVGALLNLSRISIEKVRDDVKEWAATVVASIRDVAETWSSKAKNKAMALLQLISMNGNEQFYYSS
ncbi:hypothetical protein LINPERHAP1_LOCUS12649 [Linum perenne]